MGSIGGAAAITALSVRHGAGLRGLKFSYRLTIRERAAVHIKRGSHADDGAIGTATL
jgi:hypothetical protein